jgi:hypothetical protein
VRGKEKKGYPLIQTKISVASATFHSFPQRSLSLTNS